MSSEILIVRAQAAGPHYYDIVLQWLRVHHPQLGVHFDLCQLPFQLPDESRYKLVVFWLQDPVHLISPPLARAALALEQECETRGIPMFNPVTKHRNLGKVESYRRLHEIGVKMPRAVSLENPHALEEFSFPAIVREDHVHQGRFELINEPSKLDSLELSNFYEPVVSEFVGVRSGDGKHRKFRAIVAGRHVVSHHLQISWDWKTHGSARVADLESREEEIAYISNPDPFEATLLRAAEALELQFIAFDYGCLPGGEIVIWEGNQFPHLHFSKFSLVYRNFAMDRTIATMIRAYLETAGLTVPAKLMEQSDYEQDL